MADYHLVRLSPFFLTFIEGNFKVTALPDGIPICCINALDYDSAVSQFEKLTVRDIMNQTGCLRVLSTQVVQRP